MRNEESFFQPYYRILPSKFDNVPIFWDEEQLGWLKGSYMLQQIEDRKANIRADYEEICRSVRGRCCRGDHGHHQIVIIIIGLMYLQGCP